jgi:DNA-binding LytR/AlgR family response regulator
MILSQGILVVESNPEDARQVAAMLREMHVVVSGIASDFEQFKNMMAQSAIGLVITDTRLGDSTEDFAVANYLRDLQIPMLFWCGAPSESVYKKALTYHPVAFLTRPTDFFTLKGALDLGHDSPFAVRPIIPSSPLPDSIFIRSHNLMLQVHLTDIQYVVAEGNYSTIVTRHKRFPTNMSMTQLVELLDHRNFVKVHRNYIVRLSEIESVSLTHHELVINGQIIPVSRSKFRDDLLRRIRMTF